MPSWAVPGYDLEQRIGTGPRGEVWRARVQGTDGLVAIKLVRTESPAAADQLRRAVARLSGVRHPHLVGFREAVAVDGGLVLVTDFAAGGTLASLLAERDFLTAGEVVTIGVPIASALAALHDRELPHGAVTSANVLFTADGRPLLGDAGLAGVTGRPTANAADDVRALGLVLISASGPRVPAPLGELLARAAAADPGARITAANLARLLRSAALPVAVRWGRPASAPIPPRPSTGPRPPGRSRPRRAVQAGVPLAVVAAVLAGLSLASRERPRPPPPPAVAASPTRAPISWQAVLTRLDERRNAALANVDLAALADVYAAGSAPLALDTSLVQRLTAARAHAEGLRLELRSVRLTRRTANRVILRVVDRLPAYDIVGADGRVLERRPGRGEKAWTVELILAGDGWRIAAVQPD